MRVTGGRTPSCVNVMGRAQISTEKCVYFWNHREERRRLVSCLWLDKRFVSTSAQTALIKFEMVFIVAIVPVNFHVKVTTLLETSPAPSQPLLVPENKV